MLDAQRDGSPDAGDLDDQGPSPKVRILRMLPIVIILALLIHFLLPRLGTIEDSIETAKKLAPWGIALAVLAEALSYVANGELLRSVVSVTGEKLGRRRAIAIEIGAGTISLVAAGAVGFTTAIYRWTRRSGVSAEAAMLSSWLPPLFDGATAVFFALAGAAELLLLHKMSRATTIALGIVVATLSILGAAVIVLLAKNDWLKAVALRVTRLIKRVRPRSNPTILLDAVERAEEAWRVLHRGGWLRPAVSSLLVMTLDAACLYFVFLAAGHHVKVAVLLAGYGVPLLLGRATFLPGGIAVTEVAMATLFRALGVPAAIAVVSVLTYRLISFWLPSVVGIPIAIGMYAKRRNDRDR